MKMKTVSIVGRPNVGKSTLFNAISGKKKAITSDIPGTTRDRVEAVITIDSKKVILADTGGYDEDNDKLKSLVREETLKAVTISDILVFLVDGKSGLIPLDKELADIVRKSGKQVIPVVSKSDVKKTIETANEIYELGFGEYLLVSAEHKIGIGDLLDRIASLLEENMETEEDEKIIKVSIVGRPNAGKSSIANCLTGSERVIVSEIPGTTIDSIDILIETENGKMLIIDNPGIRKKMKVKEKIERESVLTGIGTLRMCDIAILVIDSSDGLTDQDLKIANLIHGENSGFILVCNKWDLINEDMSSQKEFINFANMRLGKLDYAVILPVSAKTGMGIKGIFREINHLSRKMKQKLSTSSLNRLLESIEKEHHHPLAPGGKMVKFKYIHQLRASKPLFQVFANHPELVEKTYIRYMENKIRESFDLKGLPVKFKFMKK